MSARSEETPRKRSFVRELPVLILVALVLALVLKTFVVQAFYIPSGSMENTLIPDDRVLVSKLTYKLGDVERGDVVVFDGTGSWESEVVIPEPENPLTNALHKLGELFGFAPVGEKDFIKRVIGLPGDRVECCDDAGHVLVNGDPVREKEYLFPGDTPSTREFETSVPSDELWVMGDHRSASADSRTYGTIPVDHVIGEAFIVVWPLNRVSILTSP